MADEAFAIDGVELHDGAPFVLTELDLTPPAKTLQWARSADQDGAILIRAPFHELREIKAKVQVEQQASMDLALDAIGLLVDKLQHAERTAAGGQAQGIPATYTPAGSTYAFTFYVQAGEITGLPIGWEEGWLAKAPTLEVTLYCATAGYGVEETSSVTTSTDPIIEKLLTDVEGDLAAEARLVVQDDATLVRDHVEWGLDQATSPIILDSDSLVVTGFAGVQTTRTGAYDPDATGNNVIRATLATTPTTICGTGDQPHVGSFRIKARVYSSAAGVEYRLAWREGRDTFSRPPSWTTAPVAGALCEIDLGMVTVAEALVGTHAWEGRIEAQATTAGLTGDVDALWLVPVTAGYGKARAPIVLDTPLAFLARDGFDQSAGALNGKVLAAASSLSGPLSTGTVANDAATGTIPWTNPSNAAASDNSRATAALGIGEASQYLKATNFGFALPATATVDGIVVEMERSEDAGSVVDNRVRIVKGGTIQSTDRAAAAAWTTVDTYKSFGAANDLWGVSLAYTDINASTFGVAISAVSPSGGTARIDHVRITVYYTDGAGVAWATTGDADDLAVNGASAVSRAAVSDANLNTGRHGTVPLTLTTTGVAAGYNFSGSPVGAGEAVRQGLTARFTDVSNWLFGGLEVDFAAASPVYTAKVYKRVAGTVTELASAVLTPRTNGDLALLVDALGTFALFDGETPLVVGTDTALATGGALDDGKPGIYDAKTGADAADRAFDDFRVWSPELDHVGFPGQPIEFRALGDACLRADESGVYYGRPPEYNGSRFWLPPGDSRVAVKARRTDVDTAADGNIADSTSVTVLHRARWLVIPRSA